MESRISQIRTQCYIDFQPKLKNLPPLEDLDDLCASPKSNGDGSFLSNGACSPLEVLRSKSILPDLPPFGDIIRPKISIGDRVFAMKGSVLNIWKEGNVVQIDEAINGTGSGGRGPLRNQARERMRVLHAKQLAYLDPAKVRLTVGTRVIAIYQDDSFLYKKGEFYSGVIAEPPKGTNKYRYLVFFDDGYASYVSHENMRLVCGQTSPNVWEDLSVNQVVWTEWNGKWWSTKVLAVDASLVKLHFKDTRRLENATTKMKKEGLISLRRQNNLGRKNSPYVEYTRHMDENSQSTVKRAVARKSTAARKIDTTNPPNSSTATALTTSAKWESLGEVTRIQLPESRPRPRKFLPHTCGPTCLLEENRYDEAVHIKKNSVLILPILLGWERQITKHKLLVCRKVYYVAPCGRRLRCMEELLSYLSLSGSTLEMDFFSFDWWVHVYNEFAISKVLCKIQDISYGKESVPISCVNSLDNDYPEYVEYSTKRLPQSGVNLNLDDNFLQGCDCEDDCRDKSKCSCWQLTLQGTEANGEKGPSPSAGYTNRRLPEVVSTGIYECNPKCKCSKKCGNRVAQNPLRCKLQVFKTDKRGWGIRTLHDIPQGGFVCVYVGHLYDNEEANKRGQDFGDEYFAELDLIETVERRKEGYESDCGDEEEVDPPKIRDSASEFSEDSYQEGEEDMEHESRDRTVRLRHVVPDFPRADRETRHRRKKAEEITVDEGDFNNTEENSEERAVMGFDASFAAGVNGAPKNPKYVSTRKYFGKEEDVYIMDAKTIGNVGRYLNHSCDPNIFVQNCFVDTHDLRYPWIAFFAATFIRAGTELCWDYCYIVGQVEGKEIYCECGAVNCRGRLL
ncbi:Uncharacterized protein FKW44_012606 [Caligus rogercresseyi]|uniref:Histone-lysine N-methyltransferase eggless n=1 Tax=Caligus rogercresseyi TaxID=217165 RepID=A0A7T8HK69_CALRO|nr:Uncharacterized protein FKW44_012606 [Caligus rogercresseyi]